MTGVFRQKNPGNILILFVLGVLLKLPAIFSGAAAIARPHDGILYKKLIGFLNPFAAVFTFTYPVLAFLLLFLQAFLLTNFINTQRLMSRANFLPGMALMLISSFLPEFNYFSAPLIAALLMVYIFTQILKAHTYKFSKEYIYNCGLLLGLSTLFFFPSILFIVWVFMALAMLRPFKLNEWLLLLLGLLTPYYFYGIYLFLSDNWNWNNLYPGIVISINKMVHPDWLAGAFFLVLAPLLAGIYYVQQHSSRMLIHIRKSWLIFGLYILTGIGVSFFNTGAGLENLVLILAPVAAFHGYGYFNAEWKPFASICFWLSVAFIIAHQVMAW